MVAALIAAAPLAQTAEVRVGPVLHAMATVRIVAGKRVRLGSKTPEAELRRTQVRDSDGQVRPAQLIEFQ